MPHAPMAGSAQQALDQSLHRAHRSPFGGLRHRPPRRPARIMGLLDDPMTFAGEERHRSIHVLIAFDHKPDYHTGAPTPVGRPIDDRGSAVELDRHLGCEVGHRAVMGIPRRRHVGCLETQQPIERPRPLHVRYDDVHLGKPDLTTVLTHRPNMPHKLTWRPTRKWETNISDSPAAMPHCRRRAPRWWTAGGRPRPASGAQRHKVSVSSARECVVIPILAACPA